MHVFIVYAHPYDKSFTSEVLKAFIKGIESAGHIFEISDLYDMDFNADLNLREYFRESGIYLERNVPEDVMLEQEKINRADIAAFIYPVWWSDCPAKLKGWFDRVYTQGFAYSYEGGVHNSEPRVRKAIVLCTAGHTEAYLEQIGIAQSMRKIMLNDRIIGVLSKEAEMFILGGMTSKEPNIKEANLNRAFEIGQAL